jgi:Cd2+/Zn2+-exporting ATPase
MKKIKINIDLVLPDVPNERDECVQRIITTAEKRKGIEKVHVVPETETSKAKLCFHYNPDEISIEDVQNLAKEAGAEITERYGHLLLEVKGIRHVRHARIVESRLKGMKGILSVSVSASGWINLEFDHHGITSAKIYKYLNKIGLRVLSPVLINMHLLQRRELRRKKNMIINMKNKNIMTIINMHMAAYLEREQNLSLRSFAVLS